MTAFDDDQSKNKFIPSVQNDPGKRHGTAGKSNSISFANKPEELQYDEGAVEDGVSEPAFRTHPYMPVTPELRAMERNNKLMEIMQRLEGVERGFFIHQWTVIVQCRGR